MDVDKKVAAIDLRPDGRSPAEFRAPFFKLNVMQHADGSCLYEQGNAQVVCSVFGPLQRFRMRKLDDAAILRCHMYRSRFAGSDRPIHKSRADKETHQLMEQVLSEVIILDNYPRTRIDIVFRILQSDGNNLAVCLNAANFALMDAGINMRGLLTVANCSYVNEAVLVDVCEEDEKDTGGAVTIGSINGAQEASFIDLRGCFGRETFKEIMTTALQACANLYEYFSQTTVNELQRIHTPKDPNEMEIEKELGNMTIHEAGDTHPITKVNIAEYDKAFEQEISSDSEDEDRKMEE